MKLLTRNPFRNNLLLIGWVHVEVNHYNETDCLASLQIFNYILQLVPGLVYLVRFATEVTLLLYQTVFKLSLKVEIFSILIK